MISKVFSACFFIKNSFKKRRNMVVAENEYHQYERTTNRRRTPPSPRKREVSSLMTIPKRTEENSIGYDDHHDEESILSSANTSTSSTRYSISCKTLYALLLKKYVDKREVDEVIEILQEQQQNNNDDQQEQDSGVLDLSKSLEIESWKAIRDLLDSKSNMKNSNNNNSNQELFQTLDTFQFEVVLQNDEDDVDQTSSSLHALIDGLKSLSVSFELMERRIPRNDYDDDTFDVVHVLSLKEDLQLDAEAAMQSRDALGYVLKCHGVDAVSRCGKDWLRFVRG